MKLATQHEHDHIGAKPDCVYVSKLILTNYRCYQRATILPACKKPLVVLTGPNGAGKTNVLEAISYLAPGRGLRRASLGDITRQSGPDDTEGYNEGDSPKPAIEGQNTANRPSGTNNRWAVAATLTLSGEQVKIGTGIEDVGDETAKKRLVRIDGENVANSNSLGERWSVSWLTPQMDRLFVEGPSSRRRFLDRMVLGLFPDHSRQVGAYERVMRERNRLLADKGNNADPVWLRALETRMAEHGIAVAVARLEFAGQLAGQLASAEEGAFPKALLAIDGWVEGLLAGGMAAVEAEQAFKDRLATERQQGDGRSGSGVHKTDLVVTHALKAMHAGLCSTGEQKALLVALVLANARLQRALKGQAPLMLMDEVTAHLDQDRRSALFTALASLGSQCWLTGTDKSLFEGLVGKAEFFDVFDGSIQPSDQ
jgi:DNA replication and repair protein RecF